MDSQEIVEWVNIIFSIVAALVTAGIWLTFGYRSFRYRNMKGLVRSMTVLNLFFVWIIIVTVQNELSEQGSLLSLYSATFVVGYVVLPLTLISLLRMVYLFAGKWLISIFTNRSLRHLFLITTTVYALFYVYASGMISFQEPVTQQQGYVKWSQTYGPLSIWPSIEFWWPEMNLFGGISVAAVMMMITVSGFLGISVALVGQFGKVRKKWDLKTTGSSVGTGFVATITSFACCALPAIYPLLFLLFGTATAEPLIRLLVDESSLFVNLMQMATLSLMVLSVYYLTKRLEREVVKHG